VNKLDIQNLTLSGISHRCAQESDRFFNRKEHDPRFCYELFRRAILDQNQIAWDRILSQYQRLVTHWVERHAAFPGSGEEVQFFTNRAFEKMWIGISPKKFDKFTNLKSILKYLQMCVHSVMVDYVRKKEPALVDDAPEDLTEQPHSGAAIVEDAIVDELDGRELWRWLQEQLQDEREKCVVYAMFVYDLKPREVVDQCQDLFDDVKEVYRVKENLLARLRRNEDLRQFFDDA
jgi:DNA-directed RNA polymerase specialized sigma24 family protein